MAQSKYDMILQVCQIISYEISIWNIFSGEHYLGYKNFDLKGVSYYDLLHPECTKDVQTKHRLSKKIREIHTNYILSFIHSSPLQ